MRLIVTPILQMGETQDDSSQSCSISNSREIQFDCSVGESLDLRIESNTVTPLIPASNLVSKVVHVSTLAEARGKKSWSVCLKVICIQHHGK